MPTHGTVTCLSTTCEYTPAARFVGSDGFDYTVSDGELSDVGHVDSMSRGRAPPCPAPASTTK